MSLDEVLLRFGHEVIEALKKSGVKPPSGSHCAVMLVAFEEDGGAQSGCSLNFTDGEWSPLMQGATIEPVI